MSKAIVILAVLACAGIAFSYPIHASCKAQWEFSLPCSNVTTSIVNQIAKWTDDSGCANGGEKCLYTLQSQTATELKFTHKTPVKFYVDDITMSFAGSDAQCTIDGFSTSETWYAYLDYGTNFCNMKNLLIGSGLINAPGFKETASDSTCTQYSSADCEKY
eukprot:Colp12_sorted_trinity150504_noHs@2853